ncbi:structural protein with Ig domain [Achromobacter phage vB_AxyP_19-32_Axy12]|uniref:BIG2 domain-containing protein n=1 Tax=Achromobacter phage vB_AxyP_19-32_Axy12 TaxID=2591043 RepID=A0A514CUG1_9CAUD|nr:structural protein with Ig domain [Achromobacter phage vB_AxyP_19-32_Axy12]QDH84107.1 hypothetical protein Axy12_020 [Achromobacter phage vB_AxyP_19-32_Axy12]
MPLMQISINVANPLKRLVKVDPDGTALESGYTKIGTFDHPSTEDDIDPLGPAENHVIYHHVQEALYHVKAGVTPSIAGFWPDNITDMQSVSISYTAPPEEVVIDFISLDSPTVSVAVGATVQNLIFYNPDTATNKTLTVSSSDPTKATAVYDGPLGGDSLATGVTVTGVAAGTATITVTTANGKTATFDVTVTA